MASNKQNTDLAEIDYLKLISDANNGDRKAIDTLHQCYEQNPNKLPTADMFATVIDARLDSMLGNMIGNKLAVKNYARTLAKNLAGNNPSPLEKLLADRIAVCALDVHEQEIRLANLSDCTLAQSAHASDQLTRAHKRFLSSVKALAFVRKLNLPVVQLNIAEQQINTIGNITPPSKD